MGKNINSKHFSLEKVKSGVYAAIAKEGSGAVGNAGFVDLGDQTIVFDTFNTQQAARDLKEVAETVTQRQVSWVINSHWHGDHIRGNQVFNGSAIISSQTTYEAMKDIHPTRIAKQKNDLQGLANYIESLKDRRKASNENQLENQINFLSEIQASLPTLELVLPQHTFTKEFTFHGSKRSAQLFTLGGGHSSCDAMLYIPEEHAMFMADLLFVETHPTLFEESDPSHWLQILDKVKEIDFDIAIPGHGPLGSKHHLTEIENYMIELKECVEKGEDKPQLPTKYEGWASPEIFEQNYKRLKAFYS